MLTVEVDRGPVSTQTRVDKEMDRRPHADCPASVAGELSQRDGITLQGMALVVNVEADFRQMPEPDYPPKVCGQMKASNDHALHVLRLALPARKGPGRELENETAPFSATAEWLPSADWRGAETAPGPSPSGSGRSP